MPEIIALLQTLAPLLSKTTVRQMSHVLYGMLVASGRITMLGLSRWTDKGGSYRSLQRWYCSTLPWPALHWRWFRLKCWQAADEYILAGDEVVTSKVGKATYGLDQFFSSLQQRVISGLSFFTFSLVNVRAERSYPIQVTQVVKSTAEKTTPQAKAAAQTASQAPAQKPKRGRPKGSQNKLKQAVVLNPELVRIQTALKSLLETIGASLSLK